LPNPNAKLNRQTQLQKCQIEFVLPNLT
jgi:hypothetical protein